MEPYLKQNRSGMTGGLFLKNGNIQRKNAFFKDSAYPQSGRTDGYA